MNLDKTIKELTNRLDTISPTSSSSDKIKHNGINYWKGKRIISVKKWNELYEKNSRTTTIDNNYKITLVSRQPLQYFPDDYTSCISSFKVIEELKEDAEIWNTDYNELLEFRKNPTLGRRKCSGCIFSGHLDDPLFVGIEQVIARIVSNHCKNNNLKSISNVDNDLVSYPCRVMNFFQCPFERNNNQYSYTKESLFTLQRVAFAIEQAISTFFETTKNNEIIYEVDFVNNRVQEIHTNYNGEPESWGLNDNVIEQLSKVKPISNIMIRNEQDVYSILTDREKLECLLQEYEKENNHQLEKEQEELEIEYLKSELKAKMKEELKKHKEEQLILLKEYRQNIIDFIIDNKNSIRVEDLKIYEPIYNCYRTEKGNCHICNTKSNIICINCSNYNNEIWLCINHWQKHTINHTIKHR